MTAKVYTTFAGARRAAMEGQPILRILNNRSGFEAFLILPTMNTHVIACDDQGRADGSISFLDLSTGGKAKEGRPRG